MRPARGADAAGRLARARPAAALSLGVGPRPRGGCARPARHDARVAAPRRRAAGAPLARARQRPRPVVLVCDVSGSMAALRPDAAAVYAGLRGRAPAGGGVRLRHPPDAGHAASWPGATPRRPWTGRRARWPTGRGARGSATAIATLNREHGRRVGRGAVVVVSPTAGTAVTPSVLDAEMARLRADRPPAGVAQPAQGAHPDYEPLTRGMRAALPHVDQLPAGNTMASLEELAELMRGGV